MKLKLSYRLMMLWTSKCCGGSARWIPIGQDRREPCAEGLKLLLGVPDLAHEEVAVRAEADVVVEPVWRPGPFALLEEADGRVVLLGGKPLGGGSERRCSLQNPPNRESDRPHWRTHGFRPQAPGCPTCGHVIATPPPANAGRAGDRVQGVGSYRIWACHGQLPRRMLTNGGAGGPCHPRSGRGQGVRAGAHRRVERARRREGGGVRAGWRASGVRQAGGASGGSRGDRGPGAGVHDGGTRLRP